MASLEYINEKLSDAIYILTVDEGDARTRLAKIYHLIKRTSTSSYPLELQKDIEFVKSTIERGIRIRFDDARYQNITGIRNSTARKVIQRILFIQDKIEMLIEKGNEQ